MVHVLLKPGLENFEHYFASMSDELRKIPVYRLVPLSQEGGPLPGPEPGLLSNTQK